MATNQVTVSAVPFNQQTQTFQSVSPAPVNTPKIQPGVPTAAQNLAAFNQSMVNYKAPATTNIPVNTIGTQATNIPTTTYTPYAAPVINQASNYLAQYQEVEETAAQKAARQTAENKYNLLPYLMGQEAELAKQEEAKGVNQFKQTLTDINSQILQKQAELNQDDIRLAAGLSNVEKQAIPMQFITGQQQSIQRDAQIARALKSSEIGVLNAQVLATQGNIALAQESAQKAVDIKFAPYKEALSVYNAQLEALQPILTADEKKQASKQSFLSSLALKEIDRLQTQEVKSNDMIINAVAQGANPQNISNAQNILKSGGTPADVAVALGKYAGNFFQNEALDMELRNLKISEIASKGLGDVPVGAITKDLGITTDDYLRGIAGTESSGSRDLYGGNDPYKVLSGEKTIAQYNAMSQAEKNNTAYGKYQVMGFNIPKWTKEAFDVAMSIDEFINSPEKQEALARYQAEQSYAKYGNWDDVASVWFSGKPASGNTRSDKFGTSVPTYITKYRNNMGITASGGGGYSAETIAYSDAIDRGDYKDVNALPEKAQAEVAKYRANKPVVKNPAQIDALREQLTNLNNATSLIGGFAGLYGANISGANFLGRADLGTFFSGDKAQALGYIDNILSGETLKALIKAKEAGATFGALSNQELGLLERSANVLNKWAIRDEVTGELLGFKVNDAVVNAEIKKLKEKIQKGIGEDVIIDESTSVADDIYNMQARVYSTTSPGYQLFTR